MTVPRPMSAPIQNRPLLEAGRALLRMTSRNLLIAFLIISLIILITEFTIMVVMEPLFGKSHLIMAWVDSGILILICSPSIYFMLVKPMARSLFEKAVAERALEEMQATNEFLRQDAEDRLRVEAIERSRADARIQFQSRILSVVQQAVVATGRGGIILYWNRFAEWMFGWTEAEVRNQTLAKITGFTSEAASSGLSGLGAIKGWSGEVTAFRKDQSSFPAHLICSPIWREDNSVAGFVYTFIDITDRRAAEIAIRDSEEKYSTVVENSPTGIFIFQSGRVVFANQRFYQMVGRHTSELAVMDLANLIHPEDWGIIQTAWRQRHSNLATSQDTECRIIHSSGETRWVSGRTALIRLGGEPALLGNIQDITERHKAEQALLNSREALHRLSARLMSAQEVERQRVARELHDSLGQSLSAVKFIVERAIEQNNGRGDDSQGKTLRSVVPVIQGAVEEVRRISMALRPTTLDDLGLIATIAWFTREFSVIYPQFQIERCIEVEEFEVPETLKTNIFRILQEAMNNSAKYSHAVRLTVSLRIVLGDLQLMVRDDGVGFDPAEIPKTSPSGGFGLVSMRERAELFGGTLILTSSPEGGTMVLARWPLAEDAIS